MSEPTPSVLDRLRQPEHTGENRCVPCTAVNVVLALAGSLLVSVLWVPAAAVAFVAALAVIWLRGYLVPGTPALTRRHLPDRVLAAFGKTATPARDRTESWETVERVERERTESVDAEAYLRELDVVTTPEDADDGAEVRLAEGFVADHGEAVDADREEPRDAAVVADMFDLEPDEVAFEDRPYPAVRVGVRIRKWPGEAALLADVAAHEVLADRSADADRAWPSLPMEQRQSILESLRRLSETCPACGGPVARTEETVESCCASGEVIARICEDCDARLAEFHRADDQVGPGL